MQPCSLPKFQRSLPSVLASLFFFSGVQPISGFCATQDLILSLHAGGKSTSVPTVGREVEQIALSENGQFLISGTRDGTIQVWSTASGKAVRTLKHPELASLAISADAKTIVSSSWTERKVRVWGLKSGASLLRSLPAIPADSSGMDVSPDGKRIGVVSPSRNSQILIWDLESQRVLHTLEAWRSWVSSVKFSPDGNKIISTHFVLQNKDVLDAQGFFDHSGPSDHFDLDEDPSPDGTIRVWSAETGQALHVFKSNEKKWYPEILAISPDGAKGVFSTKADYSKYEIRNLHTGNLIYTFRRGRGAAAAFSRDGKLLALEMENKIEVWAVPALEKKRRIRLKTFLGPDDPALPDLYQKVNALTFSPDGKILYAGCYDGTIKLFRLGSLDHLE